VAGGSPLASRLSEVRSRFPRVETDAFGRRRAFFDNGAGALVLGAAAQAEHETRINFSAEHDSIQEESVEAGRRIEAGRQAVADLLHAPGGDCIVSGESATALLFDLSYALRRELHGNENLVTTQYEHYANASPWLELQARGFVREVRVAPTTEEGRLDLPGLAELVDEKTAVVSVSGASNLFGAITPLSEIRRIVRETEALFVVDAVHLVPHAAVNVAELDVDFLVFSGYKLFSTYGSFLYGKHEQLERLTPYKVKPAPTRPPWKWEHGNRDPAMFAAMNAVVDYLAWLGGDGGARRDAVGRAMRAIRAHEASLSRAMLGGLAGRPGLRLHGPTDGNDLELRAPTFSFTPTSLSPEHVVERLWKDAAVFVRQENFYSRAVEALGVSSVVRASLAHYNSEDEVRTFLEGLDRALA
jgi:cysteine desulfurase family protein (TIGR01976 family)